MAPRAVVVGGSIGGLSAAVALRRAGWSVTVHERSAGALADRGAGIVAHPISVAALVAEGRQQLDEITIASRTLRYLDRHGTVAFEEPSGYRFTSWHTLHRGLLRQLGPTPVRLGSELVGIEQDDRLVRADFADGTRESAELLVGADGISSRCRRLLFGPMEPRYAGYVGWRGTVAVGELPDRPARQLGSDIVYQLLEPGHILAYPIPSAASGETGGTAPGPRRFVNWVWYRNVAAGDELDHLLTDAAGARRALSVPPGSVRSELVRELRADAQRLLHPDLAAVVRVTEQPFVQVVVDVTVAHLAVGRACLVGDAGFVARPHAAAGTAKAADDAHRLGEALCSERDDLGAALRAYEETQLERGMALVERSRCLGDAVQGQRGWRPGDPQLLFGYLRAGDSCFW